MALLPITTYRNPLKESLEFKTILSPFENGATSAKKKRLYPRRGFPLSFSLLSIADARTLWAFFIARGGRYETFYNVLPWTNTYTGEYVGTGDASTTVFNLPSITSASRKVYVSGVEQTEGAGNDYVFAALGGTDGVDKITFEAGSIPALGEYITYDFTGYLVVRQRFAEDILNFETFYNQLVNMGVMLKGELFE